MNEMLKAENAQLKQKLLHAGMEVEKFARIAVVLVRAIVNASDEDILRVGDSLAIKREAFDAVPKNWRIVAQPAELKPTVPHDEALDKPLEPKLVVALIVSPVKEQPTLVVAREAPVVNGVVTP